LSAGLTGGEGKNPVNKCCCKVNGGPTRDRRKAKNMGKNRKVQTVLFITGETRLSGKAGDGLQRSKTDRAAKANNSYPERGIGIQSRSVAQNQAPRCIAMERVRQGVGLGSFYTGEEVQDW